MQTWNDLTDEQRAEIQKRQAEIGAQFDPETGRLKNETESTGEDEDVEELELSRDENEKVDDGDELIR